MCTVKEVLSPIELALSYETQAVPHGRPACQEFVGCLDSQPARFRQAGIACAAKSLQQQSLWICINDIKSISTGGNISEIVAK